MKGKPVICCNRPYHFCCTTAFSVMSRSGFLMVYWQLRDCRGGRERKGERERDTWETFHVLYAAQLENKQEANFPLHSDREHSLIVYTEFFEPITLTYKHRFTLCVACRIRLELRMRGTFTSSWKLSHWRQNEDSFMHIPALILTMFLKRSYRYKVSIT